MYDPEYSRAWYLRYHEQCLAFRKRWHAENREQHNKYNLQAITKLRNENPQKYRELGIIYGRKFRKLHPGYDKRKRWRDTNYNKKLYKRQLELHGREELNRRRIQRYLRKKIFNTFNSKKRHGFRLR